MKYETMLRAYGWAVLQKYGENSPEALVKKRERQAPKFYNWLIRHEARQQRHIRILVTGAEQFSTELARLRSAMTEARDLLRTDVYPEGETWDYAGQWEAHKCKAAAGMLTRALDQP